MALKHSSVFPSPPTSIKDEATRNYLMGLYRSLIYNDIDETLDTSHDAVTLAASADTLLGLSTQQLSLDTKAANLHFVGPASGAAAAPTFRALVDADLGTTLGPTFDHLHLNGGYFGKVTVVTDTYVVLSSDETVVCNKATAFTVTLPAAVAGQRFIIKNINTGTVTVDGNGSETIDGDTTIQLIQWDAVDLHCYVTGSWCIA